MVILRVWIYRWINFALNNKVVRVTDIKKSTKKRLSMMRFNDLREMAHCSTYIGFVHINLENVNSHDPFAQVQWCHSPNWFEFGTQASDWSISMVEPWFRQEGTSWSTASMVCHLTDVTTTTYQGHSREVAQFWIAEVMCIFMTKIL